jgi:cysteine-S-conjugate beta-lyase
MSGNNADGAATHSGAVGSAVNLSVPPLAELQMRRSDKWAGYGPGVISATIAEMDFPLADPIVEVLHTAIGRHDLGYTPGDVARLAKAFEGFAARRLNWTIDPGQVTVVTDVMIGLLELARLLAGPGGSVAFSTPAYPPFLVEFPYANLSVNQIPLQPDGATDLDALAAAFASGTRAFILVNPHNPTGQVLPRAELEQIAKLAADHQAWVLADEIHAPLTLPGEQHVPFLEVSDPARDRGFALTSASKAFNLAALKTALIVTAAEGPRTVVSRLLPMTDHTGLLGVLAAEAAFTDGDDWLDAVLDQLDSNRALLSSLLAERLPEVVWAPSQASYLAWLDWRRLGFGDDLVEHLLRQAHVALSPGLSYGLPGTGHARLNFGTSSRLLTEMIDRIALAVSAR